MRVRTLYIMMAVLLMSSCIDETVFTDVVPSNVGEIDSVAVGMGASFHQRQSGKTRMTVSATQNDGVFRGIEDFHLIPYATQGTIGPDDVPLKSELGLYNGVYPSQLQSSNNAVFYKMVYIPKYTASFLVYGHAPAGSDPFTYGSLSGFENITSQTKTSDITFSLDPIYSGTDVPAVGQELADYLTSIATVQYELPTEYYGDIFYRVQRTPIYRWSNPDSYTHAVLADAFEFFSNGDRVMGGSSAMINRLLTLLYNRLYSIANSDPTEVSYYASEDASTPLGTVYPYRELAAAIRAAIGNTNYVHVDGLYDNVVISLKSPRTNYPSSLSLPDGAAGIQWNANSQEFQVVMQTKASAKIMTPSRLCYPPFLCYYANSRIKTSDVDSEENHYVPTNSWSQILSEYKSSSTMVKTSTKAVAIIDAINYGVAQFRFCLKPSSSLKDVGEVHEIAVGSGTFPLTGVIVGAQHNVAYNFDPLLSSDDYSVYDPRLRDETNHTLSLPPYETTGFTQTLVMPTRKDEVVYFVLEFENLSGVDFYGANGMIMNGSKFYMTGKLDPKDGTGYDADNKQLNRVFAQDCTTEVSCQIKDLKGAWNVVPDLRDPQLEVGVSMETKWIHSTTTNVRLD